MSRRQDLAERIQGLRKDQEQELQTAHDEHHQRIEEARDAFVSEQKTSTARFHAEKAKIRERYAKKIEPLVAEHDSLLNEEKAARR